MTQTPDALPARVIAVHRERYLVHTGRDERYARVKTAAYRNADTLEYPTVGDWVDVSINDLGDSQITVTHPRKSLFSRKVAGKTYGEQAVAANFDEVFILSSMNRDFNARRIERYAALAWQSGGTPVVVLTKLDLAKHAPVLIDAAHTAAPGTEVYTLSAVTGEGLPALRTRLAPGRTVVLLGSSGVGKSSLINALAGETLMDIGAIREEDARGRHTTTHRQLLTLPCGAYAIDTPGMREIGLWDADEGLAEAFDDIEALAQSCRFSDCAHGAEPGCAVASAIEDGRLDPSRLNSFNKLKREAARRDRLRAQKKR